MDDDIMRKISWHPIGSATVFVSALLILTGCSQDLSSNLDLKKHAEWLGIASPDSDPSIRKIASDATIPIELSSNKDGTTFTVNGILLSPAKRQTVLVPRTRLEITADAPCYHTLKQTAEVDGFGRASLFQFSFANWDRVPGSHGSRCT
jgi:hypothetical protein